MTIEATNRTGVELGLYLFGTAAVDDFGRGFHEKEEWKGVGGAKVWVWRRAAPGVYSCLSEVIRSVAVFAPRRDM